MRDEKSFLGFVQTLFFLKLIVAGHFAIFNTRTGDWFFKKPYPSAPLFWASLLTAIAGSVLALYSFDLMTPVSWQWVVFLWGYVIVWFLFNDTVKRIIVRYYEKRYGEEVI